MKRCWPLRCLQGHVKEIVWHMQKTGEKDAAIFATVEDYLPADAPERLLPHAAAAPLPCDPASCAPPAAGITPLSALEAALLATLLGALLAWLVSLLVLRKRRQPATPVHAGDPAAPLVLADFPRWAGGQASTSCLLLEPYAGACQGAAFTSWVLLEPHTGASRVGDSSCCAVPRSLPNLLRRLVPPAGSRAAPAPTGPPAPKALTSPRWGLVRGIG